MQKYDLRVAALLKTEFQPADEPDHEQEQEHDERETERGEGRPHRPPAEVPHTVIPRKKPHSVYRSDETISARPACHAGTAPATNPTTNDNTSPQATSPGDATKSMLTPSVERLIGRHARNAMHADCAQDSAGEADRRNSR